MDKKNERCSSRDGQVAVFRQGLSKRKNALVVTGTCRQRQRDGTMLRADCQKLFNKLLGPTLNRNNIIKNRNISIRFQA